MTDTVTIEIPRRPFGADGDLAYGADVVELTPGVTPLVGCNGSGKSTLLLLLRERLRSRERARVRSYDARSEVDNVRDGGLIGWKGLTTTDTANVIAGSEGEGITYAIGFLMREVGSFVRDPKDATELWVLFDCIDSGLDAIGVSEVLDVLDMAAEDAAKRGLRVFAVVAGNDYASAEGRSCIAVPDLNRIEPESYGEWLDAVRASRDIRDRQATRHKRSRRKPEGLRRPKSSTLS